MAEGILGLGSGQAASLNQDLIDKLKDAETVAKIEPIETDIEEITNERETFTNIETLLTDTLDAIKPFDLFVSGGITAFESKSASTSGDSVVFDAADVSILNTGVTTVNVDTLAQKDVYQSNTFTGAQKDAAVNLGVLTIDVGGESHDFDTSTYATYDDFAKAIDDTAGINATIEQVGTDSYRLVLKSAESGLANGLSLSGTASTALNLGDAYSEYTYQSASISGSSTDNIPAQGILNINGVEYNTEKLPAYTYDELVLEIDSNPNLNASIVNEGGSFRINIENIDIKNQVSISGTTIGFTEDETKFFENSHVLEANDMKAFIDGVEYNIATNDLTVDGLKITATKTGESSINVVKDTTTLESQMQTFVDSFNLLVGTIESEAISADSALEDTSSMRSIVTNLKDKLFGTYGDNADKTIFNYGFELTEDGLLTLDSTTFNTAVNDDLDGLKDLFIGSAAEDKRGLGTQMKALLDEMTFTGGALRTYEDNMNSRETTLKEELEKAQEDLDDKYAALASQFASYAAIITQYESSFSGLQLMIQQSTAS